MPPLPMEDPTTGAYRLYGIRGANMICLPFVLYLINYGMYLPDHPHKCIVPKENKTTITKDEQPITYPRIFGALERIDFDPHDLKMKKMATEKDYRYDWKTERNRTLYAPITRYFNPYCNMTFPNGTKYSLPELSTMPCGNSSTAYGNHSFVSSPIINSRGNISLIGVLG